MAKLDHLNIDLDGDGIPERYELGGGGNANEREISWEDYKNLSEEEQNNGTTYYVPDAPGGGSGGGGGSSIEIDVSRGFFFGDAIESTNVISRCSMNSIYLFTTVADGSTFEGACLVSGNQRGIYNANGFGRVACIVFSFINDIVYNRVVDSSNNVYVQILAYDTKGNVVTDANLIIKAFELHNNSYYDYSSFNFTDGNHYLLISQDEIEVSSGGVLSGMYELKTKNTSTFIYLLKADGGNPIIYVKDSSDIPSICKVLPIQD